MYLYYHRFPGANLESNIKRSVSSSSLSDSIYGGDSNGSSSSIGSNLNSCLHWTMWETIILYFVSVDNFNSAKPLQSAALELAEIMTPRSSNY